MTTVKPYGDATNDGLIQLSFTLPLAEGGLAKQAALELTRKMGFDRVQVVHMKAVGPDFTFFVVYGRTQHDIDPGSIDVPERDYPDLSFQEVNRLIRENLKRRLVVVGACTGTDAHTVGLDAILSMKGYAGDHGLEYFPEFEVVNLGAQVMPTEVADSVKAHAADAVLISQVVTQRDAHLLHLRQVRDSLETSGLRDRVLLVGGGPRFSPDQATELGYDRIFGRGTRPSEVASYLAWTISARAAA
jgi:beta-lysine 5,6-aminomutase beta subunit